MTDERWTDKHRPKNGGNVSSNPDILSYKNGKALANIPHEVRELVESPISQEELKILSGEKEMLRLRRALAIAFGDEDVPADIREQLDAIKAEPLPDDEPDKTQAA